MLASFPVSEFRLGMKLDSYNDILFTNSLLLKHPDSKFVKMEDQTAAANETLKTVTAKLKCGICSNNYRDPRLLFCFHVFCKQCLESRVLQKDGQSIVQCPKCRFTTALRLQGIAGLQSDCRMHRLLEIEDTLTKTREPQKVQCEKCKQFHVTGYCQECSTFVCEKCTKIHQMWEDHKHHHIMSIKDVQADAVCLITPKEKVQHCKIHPQNVRKIYCETCNEPICNECTVLLHQGHQYDILSKSFPKQKQEMADELEPIKHHLATVNQMLHSFDTRSKEIHDQRAAVQAEIRMEIDQLHQALEQRKTELVGQLDQLTQQKLENLAAQRDEVELVHTQLTSCLEYVEGSLATGTQGEILEMKACVLKQVKQIADEFSPDALSPAEEANTILDKENAQDTSQACYKFAKVRMHAVYPDKCYATGDGIKTAIVNKAATATVQITDREGIEFTGPVRYFTAELVNNRNTATVKCEVTREEGSKYKIRYQPTTRGKHQLHIWIDGKSIRGSPYPVVVGVSLQSLEKPIKIIDNLRKPWGITTDSKGRIVVAESGSHCVSVLTHEGTKLQTFGNRGAANGQLQSPRGVVKDNHNNILVVDSTNHRIQKFTPDGKFLMSVGSRGNSPLQFNNPAGIAINNTNRKLYICDQNNHRVQIFNEDLTFSGTFGHRGSGDGEFQLPFDAAFDSCGNVYVVDHKNHRIQVFTPEGGFLCKFGTQGSSSGELDGPIGITIDCSDTVYVTDWENGRVSLFTTQGQFLDSFGSYGSAEGQFDRPYGVQVDNDGFIMVSDNSRIQIF